MSTVKRSVAAAVAMMKPVDMSGIRLAFPVEFEHDAQKVTFDIYEGGTEIALKGAFAKEANVVGKDGYSEVTVNPMQINETITDTPANGNRRRIGETEFGDLKGMSAAEQAAVINDAEGFGKLKKRAERLKKQTAYSVLTTGRVVVSADGLTSDEVDYGLTNIVVNDNSTAGQYQWNDTTNSDPIDQLEKLSVAQSHFAFDTVILGFEAWKAWAAHPDVRTVDNTTSGKRANFSPATRVEQDDRNTKTFMYLGRTSGDSGKPLDIYMEIDTYKNSSGTDTYYLDKNYAVCFSSGNETNAQIHYGNIPIATGTADTSNIEWVSGMEWFDGEVSKDPVGVKRYYRTSPLPVMAQPKAFASIKATLIA